MSARPTFRNYGGSRQLHIESEADLIHLLDLADARWVATSAPVTSFQCDPVFLQFLDTDHNDRIRTDEIRAALRWILQVLKQRLGLMGASDRLQLDDLDTEAPEGAGLRDAAQFILENLGAADRQTLSLAQVRDLQGILANARSNGDGVIPPHAVHNPQTAEFIRAVMTTIGSPPDAGGEAGMTRAHLDRFLDECRARLDWLSAGEPHDPEAARRLRPWGAQTDRAWNRLAPLRPKIDQFFAQCRLVRYDPRTKEIVTPAMDSWRAIDHDDPQAIAQALRDEPLAPVNPEAILSFDEQLNPAYAEALDSLRLEVLQRALDRPSLDRLDETQWRQVLDLFEPYRHWAESARGQAVASLDRATLESYLNGPFKEEIGQLIDADLVVADEIARIRSVEKLILYQRWLVEFINNFASFPALYDPARIALFETGTLILDGRELSFCLRVEDRAIHQSIAAHSGLYLLYLEIIGGSAEAAQTFQAVAALTADTAEGLYVGKHGVFYTTDGQEWDAIVREIVVNPVSLWEAFKAPFKKLGAFFNRQVERISQAQQTRLDQAMAQPTTTGALRDLLVGGSIAVAAIGGSGAYIAKAITDIVHQINWQQFALALLALAVLVFAPILVLAWLRLRRRDLTTMLEASGWAINARMYLRGGLGRLFTRRPPLPPGARLYSRDWVRFYERLLADEQFSWRRVMLLVLLGMALLLAAYLLFLSYI